MISRYSITSLDATYSYLAIGGLMVFCLVANTDLLQNPYFSHALYVATLVLSRK